jgi:hypothetical protein
MQYRYVNTPKLLLGSPYCFYTLPQKEERIKYSCIININCAVYTVYYTVSCLHRHLITPDLPYNVACYIKPKPIIER